MAPMFQPWQRKGQPFRFPMHILSKRMRQGREEYKVHWLSVLPTVDTWEDVSKLPVHLVEQFDARTRMRGIVAEPTALENSDDDE